MNASFRRPRRRKPIPAALATTHNLEIREGVIVDVVEPLVDQLHPTDDLRLRLVADDPNVRDALKRAYAMNARIDETSKLAHLSMEADEAHTIAVKAQEAFVQGFVVPAILKAEARRRMLLAVMPPSAAELAAKVARRVDADRVLAVEELLRRNPNWRDPLLWTAPDTVKYLSRALRSEALIVRRRFRTSNARLKRGELGPKKQGVRLLRSDRSPAEVPLMRKEEVAERREEVRRGLEILRKLYGTLPAKQRQIVQEMARAKCGPYVAAGRLGLDRSAAAALRARADRLLAKERQRVGDAALH